MGMAKQFLPVHFRGDVDCQWAAFVKRVACKTQPLVVAWQHPQSGVYMLNSDASVVHRRACGGGVLRDSSRRLILAYYKEFWEDNALAVESLSLLHGLWLCCQRGVQGFLVEGDSTNLAINVGSVRHKVHVASVQHNS